MLSLGGRGEIRVQYTVGGGKDADVTFSVAISFSWASSACSLLQRGEREIRVTRGRDKGVMGATLGIFRAEKFCRMGEGRSLSD